MLLLYRLHACLVQAGIAWRLMVIAGWQAADRRTAQLPKAGWQQKNLTLPAGIAWRLMVTAGWQAAEC